MLPTRILLAVLASAVVTSAAPHHLVHRQEGESTPEGNDVVTPAVETPTDVVAATTNDIVTPGQPTQTITGPDGTPTDDVARVPFGTCQSECSGAFDDLPNNCGEGKDASKCATACTMWVDKLNTCVDCMSKTANADNDSIEKVNRWTTAAGSCPIDTWDPFSGLVFGNCDSCRPALEAINADPKSCNPEQLKSCQKCMDESKEEPVANQAAKDRVQAELSNCSSAPTGCEDKCKTLMGLQAHCAPGSDQLYPLSCADSCPSKMDDVYACVSCYNDNGGVPQDISDLASSVTFYCSPEGCHSTCVSVGKIITDKCTKKDECKKNVCEGNARQNLGQCRSCLENAPMDKETRDRMFKGVAQAYDLCEKDIWPDGESDCGATCDSILDMSYNSCRNKDINQCAAVCAPDNLNALQGCMECAADGNVDNFFNQMRDWCKDDGGGNPIVVVVNPTVTVTVPNRAPPTGIAPPSRPSGKKGGITVNTSRPVVTTRRATGVNSASSITELSLTFGGAGFGAALGLVLGIVAVVV